MAIPAKKQPFPDFGKWLTYAEAVHSDTAIAHGIDNTPNLQQYNRMVYTYTHVYAPLCEYFGTRLPVNSFFRCKALNDIVPGASKTSEHMKGGAIDINARRTTNPVTNEQVFERARLHIPVDQLIFESPDEHNVARWVHVAIRPPGVDGGNRGDIMRMVHTENGRYKYLLWPWEGGVLAMASVSALLVGVLITAFYYISRN